MISSVPVLVPVRGFVATAPGTAVWELVVVANALLPSVVAVVMQEPQLPSVLHALLQLESVHGV